jgi:DNA-binding NarL/FixJ family response regulator
MATCAVQLENDEMESLPLAYAPAAVQQECVLLIEDSEEAMMLVRFAIEEYGEGRYRLEWANNLSSGLTRLSMERIDLVLLDLGLPESSGPESFAWVRQIAPQVPVVVLTGDDCSETETAVTASGVSGYLIKDQVSGLCLLQVIRGALGAGKTKNKVARDILRDLLGKGSYR